MKMTIRTLGAGVCVAMIAGAAAAQVEYSWRYYRPGNTGIQGDFNEAIHVGADGDPWISGYDPIAEEGGIARFIQSENRWFNVSNIDYAAIGSANDVGASRVSDIVPDASGNLWLGTWRGLLKMNIAAGPDSLVRFDASNSSLPGGRTVDVTIAPDGSVWVSAISVEWGAGGLTRYVPATGEWTHFADRGGGTIAAQPTPGGGYFIWTSLEGASGVDRWDSQTRTWTHLPYTVGNPVALLSKHASDDAGNVWMVRLANAQGEMTLDCKRPDGTWITPPLPPLSTSLAAPFAMIRPFGNLGAYLVVIDPNNAYRLHRFDGTTWTDLGTVPHNGFIDDLDFSADGTIWVCGSGQGGAIRRDPATGVWQRYRVTNTSQFDLFNADLTIDAATGDVYAAANAGPGVGGMVRFDGTRWTGYNELTYGLGGSWPFPTDNSEAVCVRPSTGHVAVNPMFNFTHDLNPATGQWTAVPGGMDSVRQYREDSTGRLWAIGHYGGLGYFRAGGFTTVRTAGWGLALQVDPERPGTVWANQDFEITRTDGTSTFHRTIEDFPELAGGLFTGLAVDRGGVAWFGTWSQFTSTGSTLIRLDADTVDYQIWEHDMGWPFPGEHVRPQLVTPDGRLWMTYDSEFPSTEAGLLSWDGTTVETFPAPPNGEWRRGGLPHASIIDIEAKLIPGGYELWMSCPSRGLAVLSVTTPGCEADFNGDGFIDFFDYDDFVGCFESGSCPPGKSADFNRDGFVDFFDYIEFVDAFEAGC